jgi:RNA polymerase sigma-70 factor (ECF subfamily)
MAIKANMNQPEIDRVFNTWVSEYTDSMVSIAYRYVKDLDNCMDIVQDSFISAYKALHSFDRTKNPKTWLIAIVKNKCIDHIRKEKTKHKFADKQRAEFDDEGNWKDNAHISEWDIGSGGNLMDNPKFISVFSGCIGGLPDTMSSVITLRYIDNHDAQSICDMLEITKANYWQLIHRSKLKLRNCLNINWFAKEGI